ncbi:hypothetical protein [Amycolatopsis sp. NPDC001319]|uniref:hypothetical protein n=1 Tax=unclassified Amycolatopsis TaxID=2618356 RepID=UPI0036D0D761
MSDPFTLATVSATVLPQLVKFVFEQAGKVMEKRRSATSAEASATTGGPGTVALAELERSAQVLRKYAVDGAQTHTTDRELLDALGSACQHIESLTGKPVDLATGLKQRGVHVEIEDDDIGGLATAVKATAITDKANVSVKFRGNIIRPGGGFTAVEIDGPIG